MNIALLKKFTGAAFALTLAMAGASAAHAQTTTTTTSGVTSPNSTTNTTTSYPSTVGVPNTGAGGTAPMNVAILLSAAMLATGGSLYLRKEKELAS